MLEREISQALNGSSDSISYQSLVKSLQNTLDVIAAMVRIAQAIADDAKRTEVSYTKLLNGTAYICFAGKLPYNELWEEFYSNWQEVQDKICYISLSFFTKRNEKRLVRLIVTMKGYAPYTNGFIKEQLDNGYTFAANSKEETLDEALKQQSKQEYCNTIVGIDPSTHVWCCYCNGRLFYFDLFPHYYQHAAKIRRLNRRYIKAYRKANPHKFNANNTAKSNDQSPKIRSKECRYLIRQLAKAYAALTKSRLLDLRRIANKIAALGGDIRLEYMEWDKLATSNKNKSSGPNTPKTNPYGSVDSKSAGALATSKCKDVEEVVAQKDAKVINTEDTNKKSESKPNSKSKNDDKSKSQANDQGKDKVPDTSNNSQRKGHYFSKSIQHFAPGTLERFLLNRMRDSRGVYISSYTGATNHRIESPLQTAVYKLIGRTKICHNYCFVALDNKIYPIQRDAWAAFGLTCIGKNGTIYDEILVQKFSEFWKEQERFREKCNIEYDLYCIQIKNYYDAKKDTSKQKLKKAQKIALRNDVAKIAYHVSKK